MTISYHYTVIRCIFSRSNCATNSFSSFTAPVKFVPLSLMISLGTPLRLVNLVNALRKLSVSSPHATSKWTARVVKHVNRQSQRLNRRFPCP